MYTRAYAFGPKVNPLLNASPFHSCETWLLPNARTLHMPRYQGDPLGDARNDGQVPKYKDVGARREEPEKGYRSRTSGPGPDIRPRPGHPAPPASPDIRHQPGNPAPITEAGPCQPGHPAPAPGHPASREGPDIRPVARTSGPSCLRAVYPGRKPMYTFAP